MKYKLDEDLFDDVVEIEVPSVEVEPITSDDTVLDGPEPGEDTGKSSMILDAISNCAKTIDQYNILKTNLNDSSMSAAIDKILETENITLGRLQSLLKKVSPNAENIMVGAVETDNALGESLNEDYDSHLVSYIENFFKDLTEEGDYRGYTIKDIRNALKELFPDLIFTKDESLSEDFTLSDDDLELIVKNLKDYLGHTWSDKDEEKKIRLLLNKIHNYNSKLFEDIDLNEGNWEDPEWRKYYGVDDDSFYDHLPVELEPEETFDDIDEDVPGGRFWEPGWEDANKNISVDDEEEEVPELPFESLTKTVPPFTKLKVQTATTNTTEDYKVSNMLENMLNDNSYEIDDTI